MKYDELIQFLRAVPNHTYKIVDKDIELENVDDHPYFDKDEKLWKVKLRHNPSLEYFAGALKKREIRETPIPEGKHAGHLLAEMFKPYLVDSELIGTQEVNNFFGKANVNNVEEQSPRANMNSQMYTGQQKFEMDIRDFLKKSEQNSVYYEIELISDNFKVIKGRRILYQKYVNNSLYGELVHVFIEE